MMRSEKLVPLKIVSDVTLRAGEHHVEVTTTVQNNVLDHRLRVLLPTNLKCDTYFSDSTFDVVERKVALAADNAIRKELDVETKPHVTWTAVRDAACGLAIVTRGLPEVAVIDTPERPIALTLLRAFRRAVLTNDNMGGQIQGTHVFRYDLAPFTGETPLKQLFLHGQRILSPVRQVDLLPIDQVVDGKMPAEQSFLRVEGDVVVTSVQRKDEHLVVRLFNPTTKSATARLAGGAQPIAAAKPVTLDGRNEPHVSPKLAKGAVELSVPAKRIVTLLMS
jgi:alpha-mannosidase